MTELQVTINNLKETIIAADLFLQKLEKTQKDLEKPPPHQWKHGDIFRNAFGVIMIFTQNPSDGYKYVFCISGPCHCGHSQIEVEELLDEGEFLFNIKEKL